MSQTPTLTEAAVRNLARPQSYDRGEDYYEQGAVIDVVRRGDMLRADVEGSQYEPYQVQNELDDTGVVDTMCSCPYDHGGICKHRVAVLLTYIRDGDDISQRPPISVRAGGEPGAHAYKVANRFAEAGYEVDKDFLDSYLG